MGPREVEIYLCLIDETTTFLEMVAAKWRAIEIVAAHDAVGELHGFSR
jgi:hypothetical protein